MKITKSTRLGILLLLGAASLAACGKTYKPVNAPGSGSAAGSGSGSATTGPASQDVTIDLDPMTLQGVQFRPEALGRPPMILVQSKRRWPLKKLRAAYAKAKGAAKEVQAQILATALYE